MKRLVLVQMRWFAIVVLIVTIKLTLFIKSTYSKALLKYLQSLSQHICRGLSNHIVLSSRTILKKVDRGLIVSVRSSFDVLNFHIPSDRNSSVSHSAYTSPSLPFLVHWYTTQPVQERAKTINFPGGSRLVLYLLDLNDIFLSRYQVTRYIDQAGTYPLPIHQCFTGTTLAFSPSVLDELSSLYRDFPQWLIG